MEMSERDFLEHLEELRRRFVTSLAAVGICSVVAYFFSKPLIDFLIVPLQKFSTAELYFYTPYDAFLAHLKVSFLAGVLAASPVFLTQIWLFISPGLYEHEKRIVVTLIFVSVIFFLLGAAFAFWIIIPLGLRFLLAFQTEALKPLLGIGPYFSFLIGMILTSGVVFDLPVLILGLVRVGILNPEKLKSSRKVVVVLIFVLAAILTPSPDVVSQILLALPLFLLYEVCIWGAKWVMKKSSAEAATALK